ICIVNASDRLLGQPDHQSISQNQKAYICRSGDLRDPRAFHGIQDRRPRRSKHPSLLAMPAVFSAFSITLVGRFPELTPVRSQTTSRGFLPWMPVTQLVTYPECHMSSLSCDQDMCLKKSLNKRQVYDPTIW